MTDTTQDYALVPDELDEHNEAYDALMRRSIVGYPDNLPDSTGAGRHIIPMGDSKPHELSEDCWCDPDPVEYCQCGECPPAYAHHALDGRDTVH